MLSGGSISFGASCSTRRGGRSSHEPRPRAGPAVAESVHKTGSEELGASRAYWRHRRRRNSSFLPAKGFDDGEWRWLDLYIRARRRFFFFKILLRELLHSKVFSFFGDKTVIDFFSFFICPLHRARIVRSSLFFSSFPGPFELALSIRLRIDFSRLSHLVSSWRCHSSVKGAPVQRQVRLLSVPRRRRRSGRRAGRPEAQQRRRQRSSAEKGWGHFHPDTTCPRRRPQSHPAETVRKFSNFLFFSYGSWSLIDS